MKPQEIAKQILENLPGKDGACSVLYDEGLAVLNDLLHKKTFPLIIFKAGNDFQLAEDTLQNLIIKIKEKPEVYLEKTMRGECSSFISLCKTTACNLINDSFRLKERRRERTTSFSNGGDGQDGVAIGVEKEDYNKWSVSLNSKRVSEKYSQVLSCLEEISPKYQLVFILYHLPAFWPLSNHNYQLLKSHFKSDAGKFKKAIGELQDYLDNNSGNGLSPVQIGGLLGASPGSDGTYNSISQRYTRAKKAIRNEFENGTVKEPEL